MSKFFCAFRTHARDAPEGLVGGHVCSMAVQRCSGATREAMPAFREKGTHDGEAVADDTVGEGVAPWYEERG